MNGVIDDLKLAIRYSEGVAGNSFEVVSKTFSFKPWNLAW